MKCLFSNLIQLLKPRALCHVGALGGDSLDNWRASPRREGGREGGGEVKVQGLACPHLATARCSTIASCLLSTGPNRLLPSSGSAPVFRPQHWKHEIKLGAEI